MYHGVQSECWTYRWVQFEVWTYHWVLSLDVSLGTV